jgi:hypothetical protein
VDEASAAASVDAGGDDDDDDDDDDDVAPAGTADDENEATAAMMGGFELNDEAMEKWRRSDRDAVAMVAAILCFRWLFSCRTSHYSNVLCIIPS